MECFEDRYQILLDWHEVRNQAIHCYHLAWGSEGTNKIHDSVCFCNYDTCNDDEREHNREKHSENDAGVDGDGDGGVSDDDDGGTSDDCYDGKVDLK